MNVYDSRARVYLLWAVICAVGFVTTHYYQNYKINGVWTVLSAIGLTYMYRVMPMRVKQMRYIFFSWLIPIAIGIIISGLAIRTSIFPELGAYLGAFWMFVMALGFLWNGLVDPPGKWYYIAAVVNVLGAAACYYFESLYPIQYLVAGAVSTWSMLMLWIYRSDA
jgi:hypothetical protein